MDGEKQFLKLFGTLANSTSTWQAWEDLMAVMACSISNAVDRTKEKFEKREAEYEKAIERLGGMETPAEIFALATAELERNPHQDFLGKLYMALNLGSHWHGQYFTPYHISDFMAKITIGEGTKDEIAEKGYVSVSEPCVGAGGMLIAAANAMRDGASTTRRTPCSSGRTSTGLSP